ncbi:MAG: tetratricopeptide repeat protein [Planctomycetota bacterium]
MQDLATSYMNRVQYEPAQELLVGKPSVRERSVGDATFEVVVSSLALHAIHDAMEPAARDEQRAVILARVQLGIRSRSIGDQANARVADEAHRWRDVTVAREEPTSRAHAIDVDSRADTALGMAAAHSWTAARQACTIRNASCGQVRSTTRIAAMRSILAALLLLASCVTASAQILDDDLEFEHHVATIELGKDAPVLEGIGLSREITYECHFEGTLYLSVMVDGGVDPYLRVEDQEGNLIAQDDDSGGGKHAFVKLEVKGGETLVIRVAVKGSMPAKVQFKLFEAAESERTRAAAKDGQHALAEALGLRKAGQLDEGRKCLAEAVARLREMKGHELSTLVADMLWDIGVEARELGDLCVARDAWGATHSHYEMALPDDHRQLQRARGNLAMTMRHLGDLPGARALEEGVLKVFSRTLPDEHPDVQSARLNLAIMLYPLGDLGNARSLLEKVVEVGTRTLPDSPISSARAREPRWHFGCPRRPDRRARPRGEGARDPRAYASRRSPRVTSGAAEPCEHSQGSRRLARRPCARGEGGRGLHADAARGSPRSAGGAA